jgi:alpha-ketoglutarate-dependent taurine dioxygenase
MSISIQKNQNILIYNDLIEECSSFKEIGIHIRKKTKSYGFVILKGIEIEFDLDSASLFLTTICSNFGTLLPHNIGQKDFVWEIKPKISTSSLKTFSEHNQYAPLHTDSQYRNQPEKFIALMTINQANCGGGYTNLLDFNLVVNELKNTNSGRQLLDCLALQYFPIAIPSIFQQKNARRYITAKLISEIPLIRYRYDTLKAGLSLIKSSKREFLKENLDLLDNFIENSPCRISFLASNNDIVFIDNHRFLHGRSSFFDLNRLLLRTRMN